MIPTTGPRPRRTTFGAVAGDDGYDPADYGDHIAPIYDEWTSQMDPEPAVELLSTLASPGGRILELGVGTGRLALPLAARGFRVVGIDASTAMVERLRSKQGAREIEVSIGNFADVDVEGTFAVVFVAFSTLFALPSQREQLRCLVNVVAHLEPGGYFLMDAFVPDLGRFDRGQAVTFRDVLPAGVWLTVGRHDPLEQRIESTQVVLGREGTTTYPTHVRYAWPSELDAMALAAGLEPVRRYAGYDKSPFTATSTEHVSIFRKPTTDDWAQADV
jgi:SAM-dependent methyltransferase